MSLYYSAPAAERQAAAERNEQLPDQVVDTREVTFEVPGVEPEEAEHGAG